MSDLLTRWVTLWGSGMGRIWQGYVAAQESILDLGRTLVGQTPAVTVYTEGCLRLLHYSPVTTSQHQVPVLCVPSLINRYYVMDLTPERSLVRFLLAQGMDVYMLDWGTATQVDRHRTLDAYITELLRHCVHFIQRESGQPAVSLLGYCMGGMMAAAYTVLFPAEVATLVNLAGPINYHDDGIYSVWTRAQWLNADLLVDTLGNIPAELLHMTFRSVRPTNEFVQALNYWERRDDPAFMSRFAAMQIWTNDPTPFPGEAFRKYVKDLYQSNLLIQGQFHVNDQRIDLGTITAPALTIAARQDHIAPWQSVAVFHDLVGSSDKELIVLESG
ncbi:MAG: alpha/beta fold hydrolase, partial [Anaerolineae bacterium]|nr:alpha/beta fold hydrolase [Anaerolineae bacterium]